MEHFDFSKRLAVLNSRRGEWPPVSVAEGSGSTCNHRRLCISVRTKGMGRKTKKRRQSHGSAWHWKQTDCWYYTQPGSKKRVSLFDQAGERIRGRENKEAAEVALAREKLSWEEDSGGLSGHAGEWIVARVCSEYLQYCERGVANGSISQGFRNNSVSWLNDLCEYCGALPVAQLKKGTSKHGLTSTNRGRARPRAVL